MPQVLAPRVRHGREPTEGTYSMLRPPARGLVDFSLRGWSAALVEPGGRVHCSGGALDSRGCPFGFYFVSGRDGVGPIMRASISSNSSLGNGLSNKRAPTSRMNAAYSSSLACAVMNTMLLASLG